MAAHAVDTEVEFELEDKSETVENGSARIEEGAAYERGRFSFPLPPPPPILGNNHSQVSIFRALFIVSHCLLKFIVHAPSRMTFYLSTQWISSVKYSDHAVIIFHSFVNCSFQCLTASHFFNAVRGR